jgi:HTH-type transcriptional regulator, competence development regulator
MPYDSNELCGFLLINQALNLIVNKINLWVLTSKNDWYIMKSDEINSFRRKIEMITKFGKFVRHLRLDHDIILKEMADTLGVSPAMLSGVENGKKSIPLDWEKKLVIGYQLDLEQQKELHDAILESINQVRLETKGSSSEKVDLAISFARNFDKMSDEKLKEMMELLKEVEEADNVGNK